jgi:hypothetical protein
MIINRTFVACVLTAGLLSATAAEAQLNIQLGYSEPAYVIAPPPPPVVYERYPAYYDPHHHNRDWRYWEKRHHDRYDHDRRYDHDDRNRYYHNR